MITLREWLHRARSLLRPSAVNRRIHEETEFHLDMLAEKYRRQGLTANDAGLAAKREFGGVSQMHEEYRSQAGFAWFDSVRMDLTYAWRSFLRTPGVTFLMILMLGLGIGANTAIFSFLSELLLRPLPYHDPEHVVVVARWRGAVSATTPREFALISEKSRSFESVGTQFFYRGVNLETSAEPSHVSSLRVTEGFFRTIGIQPFLGRSFDREEDQPSGRNAAILSYHLWKDSFHSDESVLGRRVRINGTPHTIIGVMPEDYSSRARAKIWLPLQSTLRGNDQNYTTLARLKPGVSIAQASAEVDALFAEIDREVAARVPAGQKYVRSPGIVVSAQQDAASEWRKQVLLLFAAVGVMLFVACLNTANLLLARSAARTREMAVRNALGAGYSRIIRQLLTESVLLSLAGGIAGLALGKLFVTVLTRIAPYDPLRHVDLDPRTLAFTAAISVLVGLLFGLAPALQSRLTLGESLKQAAGRISAGRSALRGRQILVVAQVALCTVLLAGAGLLVRTFLNIRAVDAGFDYHNLLVAPMVLNSDKLASKEALLSYYEQAAERLKSVPGVIDAAVTNQLPYEGQFNIPMELLDSNEPQLTRSLQFRMLSHNTFRVLGMRILRGRDFSENDRPGSPPAAIVNEAFVRQFFPTQDVLGKRITMARYKQPDVFSIVGVVSDAREMGPKRPLAPTVYITVPQMPLEVMKSIFSFVASKWIVRIQPNATAVIPQLRQAVGALDAAQPVQQFTSVETLVASAARLERFLMTLLAAFAALTLLMVAGGIYGTLAYMVTQRRQDIGIRMALGARSLDVITMVVSSGARQILTGLVCGLIASYWATALMTGFLFQLKPLDTASYAIATIILLVTGLLACAGPSLTAARMDPVRTLRTD